jgi:hypothetical protein
MNSEFFNISKDLFIEQNKRRPSYAALWGNDSNGMVNGHSERIITPPLPEVFYFRRV